jgi:hypothetical protein
MEEWNITAHAFIQRRLIQGLILVAFIAAAPEMEN